MRAQGFEPFWTDGKILILGSFPSVKSRAQQFYYGHPQNRFWKMLAGVYGYPTPQNIEEKKALLRAAKISLWDIVADCEIEGSADASIRARALVPLTSALAGRGIERILANGKTAYQLTVGQFPELAPLTRCMPSTSPANPRYREETWRTALREL